MYIIIFLYNIHVYVIHVYLFNKSKTSYYFLSLAGSSCLYVLINLYSIHVDACTGNIRIHTIIFFCTCVVETGIKLKNMELTLSPAKRGC